MRQTTELQVIGRNKAVVIKRSFIFIPIFLCLIVQKVLCADFYEWERAGEILKRFGDEQNLKSAKEWIQWAHERLLTPYYRFKGLSSEENIRHAILSDWEKAAKEETKSFFTAKFLTDNWEGYEFITLTYTNLDFKEQAFGVHFELKPGTLSINQVLKRYENQNREVSDEGNEKRYRYTITPGDSLKETPFGALQSQMFENDELWVDFQVRNGNNDVRYVEVLTVKANPHRVPFTKN